jgi:hypothetical protein
MAATSDFSENYITDCENCDADLDDWEWLTDEMVFRTSCACCGTDYTLRPITGTLLIEKGDLLDDEEEEEE